MRLKRDERPVVVDPEAPQVQMVLDQTVGVLKLPTPRHKAFIDKFAKRFEDVNIRKFGITSPRYDKERHNCHTFHRSLVVSLLVGAHVYNPRKYGVRSQNEPGYWYMLQADGALAPLDEDFKWNVLRYNTRGDKRIYFKDIVDYYRKQA